jgi:hypothetical protein
VVIVDSLQEAVRRITAFEGLAPDFQLTLSEQMLDPAGIHMAILTDHILARGWEPDGFSQGDGFRIYRYKVLDQGGRDWS